MNEEIAHFKRTGRAEKIFAVVLSGEPNASSAERECFPPALRFKFGADGVITGEPAEPLALDVRKNPMHRLVVRLAAGLIQAPFDALWQREQRRARRNIVMTSTAVALALLVLGAAATQTLWAPRVDHYLTYTRFVHSSASVASDAPGAKFQDCEPASDYCPEMVVIPQGRFLMGSPEDDPENLVLTSSESPQRRISISRFAVSRTEITFAQWGACVDRGGCNGYQPDRNEWEGDQRPVINVSWNDAQAYVTWLSEETRQEYRLLTEAEWEYSARAQQTADAPHRRFSWGDEDPVCQANAQNGAAFRGCEQLGTWPVGSFPPNSFGLHDMHGNVIEWVEDCFAFYGEEGNGDVPDTNASCSSRVLRGGSWRTFAPRALRSADRSQMPPSYRGHVMGFRVARSL